MTANDWSLPPLTPADRCDKRAVCNAAALVRVVLITGDLYFCKHHYDEREATLKPIARYIHDERHTLTDGVDAFIEPTPIEEPGRMWKALGIRSIDTCRWCTRRLTLRRARVEGVYHNYYVCEHCDNSEADMSDWRAAVATS